MFKRFAALPLTPDGANNLVSQHPFFLTALLEVGWDAQLDIRTTTLGHPDNRSNVLGLTAPRISPPPPQPLTPTNRMALAFNDEVFGIKLRGIRWDHLIYAYMIENTRIYEIFRRVVHEFLHGEKLGTPSELTQLWLRNTEELFYRDPPPFAITSVSSHIRPDLRGTRRNVYQRMFGMELNHGTDDNSPYPYVKAEAANNEFVTTFEEFLREVWVGYTNRGNSSGTKSTDDSKIAEHAHKLHDMLVTRRQHGNLSREEFFFVAMMSWFHLTVDSNLPIIADLRANGISAEQRLFKIAQMVGIPAHGLSRSYFEIAEPISALLIMIETGVLNDSGSAPSLYEEGLLSETMNQIITHWSIITGHDIKAGKVAVR
jgi:hypothetical protein